MKKAYMIIFIVFIIFSFISCNSKIDYITDIYIKQEIPNLKLVLVVNIPIRLDNEELKTLSKEIYNKYDGENYEDVFINFLLSDTEYGNGNYATSHYNPNLDLIIYELNENAKKHIVNNFSIQNPYWIDRHIIIKIIKKDNKYFLKQYGDDLSTDEKLLYKSLNNSDTIYKIDDNEFGEYYILDRNNNLSIYDKDGFIKSFLSQ